MSIIFPSTLMWEKLLGSVEVDFFHVASQSLSICHHQLLFALSETCCVNEIPKTDFRIRISGGHHKLIGHCLSTTIRQIATDNNSLS